MIKTENRFAPITDVLVYIIVNMIDHIRNHD